jgi:hypothetical protein
MQASGNNGLLAQPARLGGILGIGFIVLFVISIIFQGDTPMSNDSADQIRSYFVDHGEKYLALDFITGIALIFFFLPFAACLRSVLAIAEGEPGICSRLFYTGAIISLAIGGSASLGQGAIAMGASDPAIDDSALKLMAYLSDYGFAAFGAGFALTAVSAGIVMARTGVVARWVGYFGLVVAVLNVIGAAWVIDGDPESVLSVIGIVGLLLFGIWVLATSVMLLRQPQATATRMEAATA